MSRPKKYGAGASQPRRLGCARYAFEEAGLERVIAGADTPNTASLRVMEKLGMNYLGNINPSAPEEPYFVLHRENFSVVMVTS